MFLRYYYGKLASRRSLTLTDNDSFVERHLVNNVQCLLALH